MHSSKLSEFYLLGLDLSRPDYPTEFTETPSMWTSIHRTTNENIELFEHPESLNTDRPANRHRYEARFDIYSFGLVLLEIGLWKCLQSMGGVRIRKDSTIECSSTPSTAINSVVRRVISTGASLGDVFLTDFDLDDVPGGTGPSIALQLAFEKQVVFELERCQVEPDLVEQSRPAIHLFVC